MGPGPGVADDVAFLVSIGAQKGPRIGVQQGPLCVGGNCGGE